MGMSEPLQDAFEKHVALFNAAVRRGDFGDFVATFAPDAVMTFENVPVGPYVGREMIATAYAEQPPTDTMTLRSVETDAVDRAHARFDWDSGGSGSMRIRWVNGRVADLTVAFDQ
jgi:steroid delta-isomerase